MFAALSLLVLYKRHVSTICCCTLCCRGATEGLKMVSEYFPWTPNSTFTYTQANHKSVLGMGTYAKRAGAQLQCFTEQQMKDWCKTATDSRDGSRDVDNGVTCHLVAYPRKDNYEGQIKLSLLTL